MDILKCLREKINDNMSLADMVSAFEEVCLIPIDSLMDMKLFETGTFLFTGEHLFLFSLVRQFQTNEDDEEYMQLRLEIFYQPNDDNKVFSDTIWDEDIEEDFFDYVRHSAAYCGLENAQIVKCNVCLEET